MKEASENGEQNPEDAVFICSDGINVKKVAQNEEPERQQLGHDLIAFLTVILIQCFDVDDVSNVLVALHKIVIQSVATRGIQINCIRLCSCSSIRCHSMRPSSY